MNKQIWVPVSETKVTVSDGKVTIWDEIKMELKAVDQPKTGFGK